MNESLVILDITGKQATITLNRTDKANALNGVMLSGLKDIFTDLASNEDVHALVITGAGESVFCGGADLSEPETMKNNTLWDEVSNSLVDLPIFTIAKINGACIGGGLNLALGCDAWIGVSHASFGYPVSRNGLLPGKNVINKNHMTQEE